MMVEKGSQDGQDRPRWPKLELKRAKIRPTWPIMQKNFVRNFVGRAVGIDPRAKWNLIRRPRRGAAVLDPCLNLANICNYLRRLRRSPAPPPS